MVEGLEQKKMSRKDFLKLGAIGAAALAVTNLPKKVFAHEEKGHKCKHRFAMVIDLRRCVGCYSCSIACKVENNIPTNVDTPNRQIFWNQIFFKEEGRYPYAKQGIFNRPCFHCEDHPCVNLCPTGATYYDEENGLLLQGYERCIGCHYCALACPYGSRFFNWSMSFFLLPAKWKFEFEQSDLCKHSNLS